tara:strand:- start:35 stop:661 length:627 start_codon:yes stop_codon:yes gene_type:complete
MKKYLFLILVFPYLMLSQDQLLIGDVDCNGQVNSDDASLILQFVTNIIDSLPCDQNMVGLTPSQLSDMINMMSEQVVIDSEQSINSIGPTYDAFYFNEFSPHFPQNNNYFLYYFDAIRFCSSLEYNGFSDWYLPSASQIQNYLKFNTETINIDYTNNIDGYNFWLYLNEFSIGDIGGAGVMIIYYENLNFRNFNYSTLNSTNRCFCVR